MIELRRRSGILVPKKYEEYDFYHMVRSKLFRKFMNFNTPDFTTFKFFSESDKSLLIPRYFPIHEYIDCKIIDNTHEGEDIEIEHNISPRNETQRKSIEFLMANDNGILQLNPGMGKTVISIYMISERKKKSLILVHRDSLVEQWIGEKNSDPPRGFLSFTNLEENDIARLTSTTFEEDLKKPIIISTAQTFLSLLKRKRRDFLISLNKANIGVFIGDEIHTTVGAPTFSKCSIHIPSKVTIGLSATPYRWDGNTDIIKYHLGEVYAIEDDTDTMSADVTFILCNLGIDIPKRYKYLHWEGQFQRSRYLNIMKNSKVFMDLCKSLLDALKNKRQILFIGERVPKLINILYDWLDHPNKSKFIAGSPMEELKPQVTFSTPGKIRDGVDAPWKDCLIITSPVKNIQQLSGRIIRSHPNKKQPIILDIVDIGSNDISKTIYGRMKYYKERGWSIKYLVLNPITYEKLMISEEAALKLVEGE